MFKWPFSYKHTYTLTCAHILSQLTCIHMCIYMHTHIYNLTHVHVHTLFLVLSLYSFKVKCARLLKERENEQGNDSKAIVSLQTQAGYQDTNNANLDLQRDENSQYIAKFYGSQQDFPMPLSVPSCFIPHFCMTPSWNTYLNPHSCFSQHQGSPD